MPAMPSMPSGLFNETLIRVIAAMNAALDRPAFFDAVAGDQAVVVAEFQLDDDDDDHDGSSATSDEFLFDDDGYDEDHRFRLN